MNKKGVWSIIIVVLVMAAILGFTKNSVVSSDSIKIGVILPLTGPSQAIGEAGKNAVELALANLPNNIRSGIQIIYGDDQLDTKLTVSVAQKLIDVDHVKALIAYSSASSIAASYIAEKNAIPMIGLGVSPDINTGKQWVVRYLPDPLVQANALKDLILKDKYKRVAIIWNQADGPKATADQVIKTLTSSGYNIVADESVTKTENDFKTSITKLRSANPDIVFVGLFPQVGIFAKQVKDMGWKIPLMGVISFESASQIKIANGALDNQLFVADQNVPFLDEYFAKYNVYPVTADDNLYDAVTKLAFTLTQKGTLNTTVMEALRQDFVGVSGQYKYLSDGSYDLKQVVKTWNGSKFVEVK
jgi:branched-chain amino acid transport system substrate-binding protein